MSTISIKELSHPSGEVIKIASGKTLDLKSSGSVTMPTGSVLQVVSALYTTQTATSGGTYIDSGITLPITPSSTSSKIFVMVTFGGFEMSSGRAAMYTNLVRGSTQVYQPNGYVGTPSGSLRTLPATSYNFLDSPATTSETTYKVQFKGAGSAGSVTLNVNASESTITLMEIQG